MLAEREEGVIDAGYEPGPHAGIPSRSGAPDFAVCGQIRWPERASREIRSMHVEP